MPMMVTAIPFDAVNAALERHPTMALAAAGIAREEAELARLQGERRPDFVVGGGYMLMPGDAGAWTARAGITWPKRPGPGRGLTLKSKRRPGASPPPRHGATPLQRHPPRRPGSASANEAARERAD